MKILLLMLSFCLAGESVVLAEIIKLQTGQVIDGVIVEKTDAAIKVENGGQVAEFPASDIKYIRGEGIDRGSTEYFSLLQEAMNEPDTNLDGWKTVGTVKVSLQDSPAVKAFEKAKELFKQGSWDDSIAAFTEAIDGGFNLAEAYFYRANAYYNKKDLENAVADFSSSIVQQPKNPLAFGNRGECYRKLGQLPKALEDLNEAIRLDPKDDLAFANRASTHYGQGNVDQAIADMDSAIELNPANMNYYVNRGQYYAMAKKYDEALIDIEKARSMGWDDPDGLRDQLLKIKSSSAN
jgi:tetratricopeptide (TPR) repeat protein